MPQLKNLTGMKYFHKLFDGQDLKGAEIVSARAAVDADRLEGAVMSHTRKCLAAGSTPEEIAHVVLLAITTTGFPNMIAAPRCVDTVLKSAKPEA